MASSSADVEENCDPERVQNEVLALEAIYGDSAVSWDERTRAIAVHVAPGVSFSCFLPVSYPGSERPRNPTLRVESLSKKRAAEIVKSAVGRVNEEVPSSEVVLFEYIQALQADLESAAEAEVDTSGLLESSGDSQGDVAGASGQSAAGLFTKFEKEIVVIHGDAVTEHKSVFQAHAACVETVEDARGFTSFLLAKFPKLASASHNVMAYRIGPAQDFDDDGEHAAGKGLLFTLQQMNVDYVVVVVSRWFGGTKLGPLRFKLINNAARTLLVEQGSKLKQKT